MILILLCNYLTYRRTKWQSIGNLYFYVKTPFFERFTVLSKKQGFGIGDKQIHHFKSDCTSICPETTRTVKITVIACLKLS